MEKSYDLDNPWGLSFRGVFLIILGFFSFMHKPDTLAPMMLILSLLFLFMSFMTIAETLILKKHALTGTRLIRFLLNSVSFILMLMGFLAYYNNRVPLDEAREYAILLIFIVFIITLLRMLAELAMSYKQKSKYALILIIESILMTLLVISIYQVHLGFIALRVEGDSMSILHNVNEFGSLCIGFGLILIVLHRMMIRFEIK